MKHSDFWVNTPVINALKIRGIDYENWTDEIIFRWAFDMGPQLYEAQPDPESEPKPSDYEPIQMDLIDTPQNLTFRWTGMVGRKGASDNETYQFDCTMSIDTATLETGGPGNGVFEYEIEWLNGQRPSYTEHQIIDLEYDIRSKVFNMSEAYQIPSFRF
jgi:hypothetical protein